MIRILRSFNDLISKIENGLLIFLVLLMIFISFGQVVLRNFFDSGFPWVDSALRNMVLWVGFIGGSLATREHNHIKIDALVNFLPAQWKRVVDCITGAFSFFIVLVFIWASVHFVQIEYEGGGIAFLGIPFWVL